MLVPIDKIAKQSGTTKIHLAYLTKLGLIPMTIRRKINGKMAGCYPDSVITQLQKIEELKNKGLAYGQIKGSLATPAFSFNFNVSGLSLLLIGLILGYFLATNTGVVTSASALTAKLDVQRQATSTVLASGKDQPIYVIALPQKNLDKLGKMDLSALVN